MYDVLDLYGFIRNPPHIDEEKIKKQFQDYEDTIAVLKKENRELKKENESLGQQNAVLAALVRATTGIKYRSDYE